MHLKKRVFSKHNLLHLVADALWVDTLGGCIEDFGKCLVGQSIGLLIFVKKIYKFLNQISCAVNRPSIVM